MRRISALLIAISLIAISSCKDPQRSQQLLDEGINLMTVHGKYADAEAAFTKAIQNDANNYEAYYYRGCTKFNRSMYDDAVLDFQKALDIKPEYPDAEFALGRIYYMKNDFEMACYYYKAAAQHGRPNMEDYIKPCQ